MPMDPQLAAIYNTNQDGEDTEKLAAAQLAEKLAADGEADTESFSDEQIEELARQAVGAGAEAEEGEEGEEEEEEEEAPGQEKTSAEEEANEKLAEADYLGRVMAHAYTQELRNIASAETEKTAGIKKTARFERTRAAAGKVMGHLAAHGKKYSAGAGAAAGFGAGRLSKRGKKKQSAAEEQPQPSALDLLAAQRAEAILKENGIELEKQQPQQTEKTSASESEQQALANAVERRAYEMLQQAGYVQQEEPEAEGQEEEAEEAQE